MTFFKYIHVDYTLFERDNLDKTSICVDKHLSLLFYYLSISKCIEWESNTHNEQVNF